MLFNSSEFMLVFLPVVFAGFFWIARRSHRLAAVWLGVASLFFYGWWNPRYVPLLVGSVAFNYAMGYAVARAPRSRGRAQALLVAGIGANLTLLGYFKYTNFFISTLNTLGGTHWSRLDIVLPLGISFFTFTQIAFLVDVCRGFAQEYDVAHYLLFVTYFPHLIAGPLLYHRQIMPQFAASSTYRLRVAGVATGWSIFLIGLAKKVVLADSLGAFVGPVFSAPVAGRTVAFVDGWLGALCYTFQLYFDFSGYSDMAIGISLMFGVTLPLNFNSPYKAWSIVEFWRRWHMTLSHFLREYLYIPLGGNRRGPLRRHVNVMTTMLLGGLWHGANWTFVVWGGLHGVYLVTNHLWRGLMERMGRPARAPRPAGRVLSVALTFLAVVVAWVFFRADTLTSALSILGGMAGVNGITLPGQIVAVLPFLEPYVNVVGSMETLGGGTVMGSVEQLGLIIIAAFICFLLPNTQHMSERARLLAVVVSAGFIVQAIFFSRAPSEFLYFQF
jgi:alginate O-acetyltransferase complex protein AlgI